ncbi:hypothetical protein CJF31_00005281 [Rutstroemia sp. NJR-2017a BVV2]|nr:hypothetical protein CJF31_00005281 [Rutstroemia sp. NJR-2017a BVV2]
MESASHSNASRRVPFDKRKRTETSCDKCKSRKQKCDRMLGQGQCRYCELHRLTCTTNQPRKKRFYGNIEGLGGRLILLESLVKGLLPEADLSGVNEMQQLGKALGIPLPHIEDASSSGPAQSENNSTFSEEEQSLPLLPDQQGQVQYIGPSSSFSFHLKLRRLIGNYTTYEFAMFGRNAAEHTDLLDTSNINITKADSCRNTEKTNHTNLINVPSDYGSPSETIREIDGHVLDCLVDAYFDIIHSDFPVLHEASFRETYEQWSINTHAPNSVWLCSLLCVLILALRVSNVTVPEEIERKWWKHIQILLPTVFFTSNILTVQALMLAALHLHNNSHRDACWNLTGTAVRIAFAIGLHRDDVKHGSSPLGRELMKQLWWTLYAFEQMQVSSYDRPSAMESNVSSVGYPNERMVGVAGHCPQDFMKWSQKLVVLLGSACKALNVAGIKNSATEDVYAKPLSPAAAILRDLNRWKVELPAHLRLEVVDSVAPSSQRPLILLHIQYYYTQILMTRSALLRRATALSKNNSTPMSQIVHSTSETCIDAGRNLGRLLLKLESIKKFNPYTWWDVFYTVASALVLVLDISCRTKEQALPSIPESQDILRNLSNLMSEVLQDPKVPDSMKKWATIVCEVKSVADEFHPPRLQSHNPTSTNHLDDPRTSRSEANHEQPDELEEGHSPHAKMSQNAQTSNFLEASSRETVHSGTSRGMREENDEPQHFWTQFMDGGNAAAQDWNWDGIEALLRAGSSL